MIRPLTHIGNPVLRHVCDAVDPGDIGSPDIQGLIEDLIDTKRHANGAGIAAPQIDVARRVFIVEVHNNPRYPYKPEVPLDVVINPDITFLTEDRYENFEGCLSIPGIRARVPRCPHIRVTGFGRDGTPFSKEVRGITAGTYQHEFDHVNGILFPDRVQDTSSYCTWEEFHARYEEGFRDEVASIVARWGA